MLEDIREVRRAPGRCCGATAHGDQGLYLVRAVAPSSRTKANIASSLSHADRTDGRDAGDFGSLLAGLGLWLTNPKLRLVRQAILGLTWCFAALAGWCSGYVKVRGIVVPRRLKASRWALVGSVSIGMVTWVPVYRTWLRVRVARCCSRPRKLR